MAGALTMNRRGQMLVETALIAPLFILLALLTVSLADRSLAGLKAQEAARLLAWKGLSGQRARKEAEQVLAAVPGAKVEKASVTHRTVKGGMDPGEDPLVGGWAARALRTSIATVDVSVPPWPWGGDRLARSAAYSVDLGRRRHRKDKGMDDWVRRRVGAKEPPAVPRPPGGMP